MNRLFSILPLLLICWTTQALAHQPASSYILLQVDESEASPLALSWRVHVRDLAAAVSMDDDGDGAVSWQEVQRAETEIQNFFRRSVRIRSGSMVCSPEQPPPLALRKLYDGLYLSLDMPLTCDLAETVTVEVDAFFEADPLHRTIVSLMNAGVPISQQVLASAKDVASFESAAASTKSSGTFTTFVYQGIWHIAIGLDHILFVLTLLLSVVLVKTGHAWQPARSSRPVLLQTLKLVTAFTVAHSITLSLSVLGWIQASAIWVESIIALSVAVVALNNIRPVLAERLWIVTFMFGLIHGLGFASVLLDLGLPASARGLALLAFNIGVELGQLLLVALALPPLLRLRHLPAYTRWIMPALSVMIAIMAGYWVAERTGLIN
ncbi:HupE/UreJ family protein [Allohahella sp. A8]|uniref:HupE/UreJ family protein n=1 Tax=Allohahella sp. A8 TaxID=3141461 RepID=UPI003A7FCBD5